MTSSNKKIGKVLHSVWNSPSYLPSFLVPFEAYFKN